MSRKYENWRTVIVSKPEDRECERGRVPPTARYQGSLNVHRATSVESVLTLDTRFAGSWLGEARCGNRLHLSW